MADNSWEDDFDALDSLVEQWDEQANSAATSSLELAPSFPERERSSRRRASAMRTSPPGGDDLNMLEMDSSSHQQSSSSFLMDRNGSFGGGTTSPWGMGMSNFDGNDTGIDSHLEGAPQSLSQQLLNLGQNAAGGSSKGRFGRQQQSSSSSSSGVGGGGGGGIGGATETKNSDSSKRQKGADGGQSSSAAASSHAAQHANSHANASERLERSERGSRAGPMSTSSIGSSYRRGYFGDGSGSGAGEHSAGSDSGSDDFDDDLGLDDDGGTDSGKAQPKKKSSELESRVKNREHAKNTRMRKKTYIDNLRDQVLALTEEREKIDKQRNASLLKLVEQKKLREKVIETFLHYRTTGELSASNWSKILDGACELVLPVTPYRSFPPHEVQDAQRHIRGIPAIMQDTASLTAFIQSLGRPSSSQKPLQARFYALSQETIMSGDTLMCHWYMRTENAVEHGVRFELSKHGYMKAFFSPPSSRLTFIELSFDVMSFMQQLRRASGTMDFNVVPNNLALALEPTSVARLVCSVADNHKVLQVSPAWCELFGCKKGDIEGKPLEHTLGQLTAKLRDSLRKAQDGHTSVLYATLHSGSAQFRPPSPPSSSSGSAKSHHQLACRMHLHPLYQSGSVVHISISAEAYDEASATVTAATSSNAGPGSGLGSGGGGMVTGMGGGMGGVGAKAGGLGGGGSSSNSSGSRGSGSSSSSSSGGGSIGSSSGGTSSGGDGGGGGPGTRGASSSGDGEGAGGGSSSRGGSRKQKGAT